MAHPPDAVGRRADGILIPLSRAARPAARAGRRPRAGGRRRTARGGRAICGSSALTPSSSTVSSARRASGAMSSPDVSSASSDGHEADRGLDGVRAARAALDDPRQHARVLAEPGPEELPVLVLAEPVDVEDLRQLRAVAPAELQPVREVVGHVVAAEGQHRERVEAQLADLAGRGRGRLRAHRRAEEHRVLPVERLAHQRDDARAAAAEQERVDRHALRVLPLGGDRRTLVGRDREAGIRDGPRARRRPASSRCPSSRRGGPAARRSSPPTRRRRRRSSRSW